MIITDTVDQNIVLLPVQWGELRRVQAIHSVMTMCEKTADSASFDTNWTVCLFVLPKMGLNYITALL